MSKEDKGSRGRNFEGGNHIPEVIQKNHHPKTVEIDYRIDPDVGGNSQPTSHGADGPPPDPKKK